MKEMFYRDWYRYEHAEFLGRSALPFIQAQHSLDVTHFKRYVKANGISFYFGLIWASCQVIDAREDFRWRLRGDRVVLVESPEPSFTDLSAGEELFKIVNAGRAGGDMAEYAKRARAVADAQTAYFPTNTEERRDDFTYFSSVPGVTFTSLMQPMDLNRDAFIPQIAWSKYEEKDGKFWLPYTVLCNHRQVDGFHVARFFTELQFFLNSFA